MVSYDESVIIEFADRLYRRARSIVVTWTLFGGGFASLLGWLAGSRYAEWAGHPTVAKDLVVIAGLVGALAGFIAGRERSFALRLQAQTALCQAQIERNTRAARTAEVGPPPVPMRR